MDQQVYIITFENGSVADANRWASELKESILDATPDVEVKQQRDNSYSQDLGTTLSLVLGTPAVIAVANALGNWLMLYRQVGITIKTPHGDIIGTNLTSKDALKLAELLLAQQEKQS
jgi:hypothetical protein